MMSPNVNALAPPRPSDDTTSASANTIVVSSLGRGGAKAFTLGDIISLALTLDYTSGSTTAGCPYFIGMELDYKASTL